MICKSGPHKKYLLIPMMEPDKNIFSQNLVLFGRLLRRAGFQVSPQQTVDSLRALNLVGIRNKQDVYWTLCAIFVSHQEQLHRFEKAFSLYWRTHANAISIDFRQSQAKNSAHLRFSSSEVWSDTVEKEDDMRQHLRTTPDRQSSILTYSSSERLRRKDFAEYSEEDKSLASRLMIDMNWALKPQQTRRLNSLSRNRVLDLGKMLRRSQRHYGEIVKLNWRGRKQKPRGIIILCDISGSMERYSFMLLHFMHIFASGKRKIEAFVFGTRLTRISHLLANRNVEAALVSISKKVNDWGGGTRIGAAFKEFNYKWSRQLLRSSDLVIVISDGLDRGDIPLLRREASRLSRKCSKFIWLNPLLGYPDYSPETRGIKAVFPYIDELLPVHNLQSLERLTGTLNAW